MSAHNVSLLLLTVFTTILAVQVGSGLHQTLAELTTLIAVVTIGHVCGGGVDPSDRTLRAGAACALGMFLLQQAILWQRGESRPMVGEMIATLMRFALPAGMIVWAALVSRSRSGGQYVYNLVVVSAMALWMGQVVVNATGAAGRGLAAGGLAAFLQGAATGSAFAYATLDFRGSNESGGHRP